MFQVGDAIGEYTLTGKLGEGAYGVVFRACNNVSEKSFALKVVPQAGRAFERELHALKRYREFDHKNLMKIHHAGISGDYLYYTMDLADGKLADGNLDAAQLRDAAAKIADALALLHQHHLLHRDIKPDNLFLRDGEAVLGDIGLVTRGSEATFSGTPGFVSPRIWREELAPDEKSDLYALAKCFYCLLSGNRPSEYPRYSGNMSPDASILLDAILSVCDDDGTIASAADFRARIQRNRLPSKRRRIGFFFRNHFAAYRKIFRFLRTAAWIFMFLVAVGVAVFAVYSAVNILVGKAQLREYQEKQQIAAKIREKEARYLRAVAMAKTLPPDPHTMREIERETQARQYALEKIPMQNEKNVTSLSDMIVRLDAIIARDKLQEEYLKNHPLPEK